MHSSHTTQPSQLHAEFDQLTLRGSSERNTESLTVWLRATIPTADCRIPYYSGAVNVNRDC